MKTLIKNAHLISDGVDIQNAHIVINGKHISSAGSGDIHETDFDKIFDAKSHYVCPGFIDIHTHGALGYHTCDARLESLERIAEVKMRQGVTTFYPSSVTMPEEVLIETVKTVAEYDAAPKYAKVAGVHLEGPFLNPKKLGGQNPAFIQPPNIDLVKKLNTLFQISMVSFSPEMDGAMELARDLKKRGIIASIAHSAADYHQVCEAVKNGVSHLTHFCNQMTPLHHRDVGAVGAGLLNDKLSVELICDKLHLCPEMIQLIFKCKPLDTIILITDSSYISGLPDGVHELRGLRAEIKNNVIRLAGTDTLCGSGLAYNIGLKNVVEITQLPLKDLIRTTSLNQALELGLNKLGKIEEGYVADIIVMDNDFDVKNVFIDGVLQQ